MPATAVQREELNRFTECNCIVTSIQHTFPEDQSTDFRQILPDYSSTYEHLIRLEVQKWDVCGVNTVTFSASFIVSTLNRVRSLLKQCFQRTHCGPGSGNDAASFTKIGFSTGNNEYEVLMRNALVNLIIAAAGYATSSKS
jgi:hypothetical protein